MKRHQIRVLDSFIIGAAFILAACTDMYLDTGERPIQLSAGPAFNVTRATTDLQGPAFQAGEEVSVFIKGKSDLVEETQLAGYPTICTTSEPTDNINKLTPVGEQPYYPYGDNSKATIFAVYPKEVAPTSSTIQETFTVAYDQTADDDYKKSDLMMVPPFSHDKNASVVNLPFEHKMAKLIITAIGDPGIQMDGTITVGGVYRSIKINVPNGSYKTLTEDTPSGNLHDDLDDRGPIVMTNGGAVLIPPQEVTTSDEVGNFITVTGRQESNPSETLTAKFNIIQKHFKPGMVYRLVLAIRMDNFSNTEAITGWSDDYGELTVTPSGGYEGITIDNIDGTISTADGGDADGYYVYTGTERCPTPDVWYGTATKKKLAYGSEYIYRYVDNKNAGMAQVLILGQNYYAGLAATKGFTIRQAQGRISFAQGSNKTNVPFNLNEIIDPAVLNNTGDGVVTYTAADAASAKVVAVDPTTGQLIKQNVGTATIKAEAADGTNYYYKADDGKTATYTVQIVPKPEAAEDLVVTYETDNTTVSPHITDKAVNQYFVYNGEARELKSLSVYDRVADVTLVNNVDYTYTLTNNTNAGNALLNIKGVSTGNYATVDINVNVPIAKAKPTITVDQIPLTIGIHSNTAPKNRRKTRVATTQSWAANNLQYSFSETSKVQDNTYLSINDNGLITGKAATPANTPVTVYVKVLEDATNWDAATTLSYTVTVVNSDFDFNLYRDNNGDVTYNNATSGTLNTTTKRVVYNAAHSTWTCPASGTWQLDCWGAQGASTPESWTGGPAAGTFNRGMGGRGAHIAGRVYLKKGQVLHVVVGEQGRNLYPGHSRDTGTGTAIGEKYILDGFAWNGGANFVWGAGSSTGHAHYNNGKSVVYPISGGGGATDMSLLYGTYAGSSKMVGYTGNPVNYLAWKSPEHLYSRIIVAGGGGGGLYYDSSGDGKGFGDGGDGGAYVGVDGLFNDYGLGGQMDRGGYGGKNYNWQIQNSSSGNTMTHALAKSFYDVGPYAGGWSGTDGMFGEGGYYVHVTEGNGCGGGGWYGGGAAGQGAANGSGGGGSSFLWTSDLAVWYDRAPTLAHPELVTADASFFNAPSTKYPNYVPQTSDTSKDTYFPYMTEVIVDAGARAGDGKAMITAVELDDVCISK